MWVNSHSPKKREDAFNSGALLKLEEFLRNWKKGDKALLLYGPPGVGKTSGVYLVGKSLGFEIVETNASDTRNRAAVERVLGGASRQSSLFGEEERRLVLIDEVDGISARKGDYGGISAIAKVIRESAHPVVLTANSVILSQGKRAFDKEKWEKKFKGDVKNKFAIFSFLKEVMRSENEGPFNEKLLWAITYANFKKGQSEGISAFLSALPLGGQAPNWWEWNQKLAPLKSIVTLVEFGKIPTEHLLGILEGVAKREGILASEGALLEIASRSGGDARHAITLLEAVGRGKKELSEEDVSGFGGKERRRQIEEAVRLVLATTDPKISRAAYRESESDPREFAAFLEENLASRYRGSALAEAYSNLSLASQVSFRIIRTGSYSLLPFQVDLITAGVSSAKGKRATIEGRIVFPAEKFDSRATKKRRIRTQLERKIRKAFPLARPRSVLSLLKAKNFPLQALPLEEEEEEYLAEERKARA